MNVAGERSGAAGRETAGEAVPEFYVALEFTGDGRCCQPGLPSAPLTEVVVRVTATGTALAAISAPRPYGTFTGITAAADHRTFVLAAQKLARLPLTTRPVTRFFLLRVDPASPVPASPVPASPVPAGRARLEPLAIPEQPPGLLASSRLVLPTPTGPENSSGNYWRQVLISADGQVIIAVIQVEAHHASGRMPGVTQKLVTFSATTGTLLRELNHLPVHGGYEHVPWASPSGRLLIVTGTQPGPTIGSFNLGHSAGTLSQGRFTPIPWSTRTFAAAS